MPFAQKEQTFEDVELNIRNAYISFLKREDLRLLDPFCSLQVTFSKYFYNCTYILKENQ
jgi:hypothetical protein